MASNSLGTLTLDLIAKIGGFTGPIDQASRTVTKRMADIKSAVTIAAGAMTVVATAAVGAGAALVNFTKNAGDSARELQNQARLANSGVEDFQKWAYAANTVGIQQEKLSDILKDTNDKVGDFLNTGGGEMQQFFQNVAPKVGVTAEQFKNLSGPQALQLYYNSLQKANLSQADMTFYMEAIADEATGLIPLLKDNGKALNEMGAEADSLGIVLSQIDVANLAEFANQFDKTTTIIRSFGDLLAASIAPYLTVLNDRLIHSGISAQGFGDKLSAALEDGARALIPLFEGFDKFNAIDADFQVHMAEMNASVAKFALDVQTAIGTAVNGFLHLANAIVGVANVVPGVNIPKLDKNYFDLSGYKLYTKQYADATNELAEAMANQEDAQKGSGWADSLKKYIDEVHELRIHPPQLDLPNNTGGGSGAGNTSGNGSTSHPGSSGSSSQSKTADAIDRELAKQFAEEQARINNLYKIRDDLIADNMTQSEKAFKQAQDQFAKLKEVQSNIETALPSAQANQLQDRIFSNAFSDAPDVGTNQTVSGRLGRYDKQQQELNDWYQSQMDLLNDFNGTELATVEEQEAKKAEIRQKYQALTNSLEQQRQEDQLGIVSSGMSSITDVIGETLGKQSGLYKAAFLTQKAAAIAQSIVAIQSGIAQAAANPWPTNLAAMASVASATAGIVSSITSTNIQGMAHDGIDSIPEDGTWMLQKGERVTTEKTSRRLDNTLDRIDRNRADDGARTAPSITINNNGEPTRVNKMEWSANDRRMVIDLVADNMASGGKVHKSTKSTFGLSNPGR